MRIKRSLHISRIAKKVTTTCERLVNPSKSDMNLAEPLLWAVMARAPLFVFPSRDEGFGLPPLEAMALGTPVVVSNAASLPEVCGPGAAYVDSDDVQGLSRTLVRLLDDPAERKRMGDQGRTHARQFTWDRVATHLLGVYQGLLGAERR